MGDYKYEMQLRAEQAAEDEYGKDFYDLPSDKQDKLFNQASVDYAEDVHARAEALRDAREDALERSQDFLHELMQEKDRQECTGS